MQKKKYTGKNRPRTVLVRPAPGDRRRALVIFAGRVEQAAIGRGGVTSRKREGDGATPIAGMRLLEGYIRSDRVPALASSLNLKQTPADLFWCDAPAHGNYNRPVRAPFKASHETMRRTDELYDVCLVMDWNISSRRRNAGSAIFFHIAKSGYPPTEGCVAVSLPAMRRLLRFVRKGDIVKVG